MGLEGIVSKWAHDTRRGRGGCSGDCSADSRGLRRRVDQALRGVGCSK
jgi:hypothetical protein